VTDLGRGESETDRLGHEADGEKHGVHSSVRVSHVERNDQLFVRRLMLMVEQE